MELELADEDEPILFKIAAAFYHLTAAKATERMDEEVETLEGNLEALEREQDECKEKMDELKATLYAKFGSRSLCPSRHLRRLLIPCRSFQQVQSISNAADADLLAHSVQ